MPAKTPSLKDYCEWLIQQSRGDVQDALNIFARLLDQKDDGAQFINQTYGAHALEMMLRQCADEWRQAVNRAAPPKGWRPNREPTSQA